MEECERYRLHLQSKIDEFELKQREIESLTRRNHDLELSMKSIRENTDVQKQLNVENENNKQELKRKQDDFEQFQRVRHFEFYSSIQIEQRKIFVSSRCTTLPKKRIKRLFIFSK